MGKTMMLNENKKFSDFFHSESGSEHRYVSRILVYTPGTDELAQAENVYRRRIADLGAALRTIQSETVEFVTDPDESVRAVLYRFNIVYAGNNIDADLF